MDEYISREAVYQVLCEIAKGLSIGETEALKTKDLKAFYKIQGAKEILSSIDNDLCLIPSVDVQPTNPWISVKDKLPNHYDRVLIVSELENVVYMAYFDKDIDMFMGAHHMWTTGEAKYWQPLPKPPKDGE